MCFSPARKGGVFAHPERHVEGSQKRTESRKTTQLGSAKRCGATLKPRRVIAMRANSPFFPQLPVFPEFGRLEAITGLTF
jgi:hypothetical protein